MDSSKQLSSQLIMDARNLITTPQSNSNSIDELTTALSQTHIDHSNVFLQPLNESLKVEVNDEVTSIICSGISAELQAASINVLITPEHECFASVTAFQEGRGLQRGALDNFKELARGNPAFPTILLWRPSNDHERASFAEMCDGKTISWIAKQLKEIGLSINDVIILDVCPLVSKGNLDGMSHLDQTSIKNEAYEALVEVLKILKPKVMISCQCKSGDAENVVTQELCSSYEGARAGKVKAVEIEDHEIQVIQGFHPMFFLYEDGDGDDEAILKGLFQRLFSPCALWKREAEILVVEASLGSIDTAIGSFTRELEKYEAPLGDYIRENYEQDISKSAPNIAKRYQDALAKHEHITREAYDTLQRISATVRKIVEAKLSKYPLLKKELSKSLLPLEWPTLTYQDYGAAQGSRERTALYGAAKNGHEAVVKLLLEAKADVNVKDNDGWMALHEVAESGHEAAIKLLLEAKADINVKDIYGNRWTALHWAAKKGHEAVVKLLLEAKADVNVKDNNGGTALHWAASNEHKAVVKLLLEAKADSNLNDSNGWTVLHVAAMNGHETVVKLLLEAKADVNVKNNYGWTALHVAAMNGHEAVVKLLLEAKADVNMKNNYGWTALHRAAKNGHEAVVKLLLEAKVKVNMEDNDGWTALHRAAKNGHEAVIKLLLEAKAIAANSAIPGPSNTVNIMTPPMPSMDVTSPSILNPSSGRLRARSDDDLEDQGSPPKRLRHHV
jgi:ankyrin repeat protein/23S rRNA U2552 (ribose-2'-O)-methylase RlmE/FtsJ